MGLRDQLLACTGFEWDRGNLDKIWDRHQVTFWEAEEVFLNQPLVLGLDPGHSAAESRCFCLGRTDAGRRLFIVFTLRRRLIRVISARDMTRKERRIYERHEEEDSEVQK